MTIAIILIFVFHVLEPIILAFIAQKKGHIGFFWFIIIFSLNAAYSYYNNESLIAEARVSLDPNFYANTGNFREIGYLILGCIISPIVVLIVLWTWPDRKPSKD